MHHNATHARGAAAGAGAECSGVAEWGREGCKRCCTAATAECEAWLATEDGQASGSR